VNHLRKCEEETGVDMNLPFDRKKVMEFLGWMEARGLKSRSMSTYLSGVRAFHIASGYEDPFLRDPMVKLILKGQDNWDKLQDRLEGKVGKLPVTINVMMLLKKMLVKVDWTKIEKRLFWAVATVAWSGSFRIHELVSRKRKEFDGQTTLLWGDVGFGDSQLKGEKVEWVSVHVKSPKVDRVGAGDRIQVFQLGSFMCPVAAMSKWRKESKLVEECEMPVFRHESGLCLTGAEVNKMMKVLTEDLSVLVPGGEVRSHSFRSGVPSEMAKDGRDAESIQAVGRWKSDAYKSYVKLPLTRRAELARSVGKRSG
jgi:site-specific recombinase XerC